MAIGDAYATAAQYRDITGKTDTSEDAEILDDLKAISRYLEGRLGRFFNKDSADVTRVYMPRLASSRLEINDLSAAPTSILLDTTNDGTFPTALAVTDYELWPPSAPLSPEPWPYTHVYLASWGAYSGLWSTGRRVRVVGKFGWPAVPTAITRATVHLAAILRLESPRATSRISEMDGTISASPQAQSIINKLLEQYQASWFA